MAVAALSFFHPPLGLAISIVLNVALIIGVMDYGLLGRKKTKSVTKTDSHLELRVHGDGRAPTGIVTTNIWRWFTLDLGVLSINNETGERSDMHLATVLFVTFDQMTTTRNLSVSSPDMVLPRYEVKDFCERSAVISFETKLSPGILFVRTHH